MARIALTSITPWITAAAVQHPHALPAQMVQRLGISRRRASGLLKKLLASQWLAAAGTARRPVYRPGGLRQVVRSYPLAGLQEDLPWRRDFAPFFELPAEVRRMAQHAFTELVNNAVDHSGGRQVTVSLRQTPLHLQLLVSDDGCGLFKRVAQSFAIDDPSLAMFELSKGKLSSEPDRHAGHGLFFCSRLADVFDVHANQAAFQYRGWSGPAWYPTRSAPHQGTSVYLAIALDTQRQLDAVLRAQSASGAGYGFENTRVPLRLLCTEQALTSRAEAKRVVARLQQFERAEIDFAGVDSMGHGFADELFRVFTRAHPSVELLPMGMNAQVRQMLASITG